MAGVNILFVGRRAFEKRMRDAERNYRKALRKQLREGAKVLRKETKKRAKAAFPGGRGTLAKAIRFKVRVRRNEVNAWVGVSASKRVNKKKPATRFGHSNYSVPSAYAPILQKGGTVRRGVSSFVGGQSGRGKRAVPLRAGAKRRRAHTANYGPGRPFQAPAIRATKKQIFQILGRSFQEV